MSIDMRNPDDDTESVDDTAAQAAELEVLRAENERLRAQFRQAKQTTYRRTILAFVAIGTVALVGGALFPDVRVLLTALGATAVFGAILTYFVTPEQFHAATVSERIYETAAANAERVITELGLQNDRVYVPIGTDDVRLYVPSHRTFSIPDPAALESLFVVTADDRERGAAFQPFGTKLYETFEDATSATDDLQTVGTQLADAIVEQFELASSVDSAIDPNAGEARFEIAGSTCGAVGSFDQPIVSLLATGLAIQLEEPVRVEYPAEGADSTVRCVWNLESA